MTQAAPQSVPRSEKVIKMHVDEMCDREVNFLLKRRGTAIIPADIDQAREMAKEQRAKVSFCPIFRQNWPIFELLAR